jgi:hypothetical protein
LFTAIACSFAAFAYAEFASMACVRSAYTYSYVALGIDSLVIGCLDNGMPLGILQSPYLGAIILRV